MEEFVKHLRESYSVREYEDGFIVTTPILYRFADHTFSFFIKKTGDCGFIITDLGQTLDYLNECFDPEPYMDKIQAICKYFSITLENDVFTGQIASYETNQAMRTFHMFIGAMNMIANIDVFDEIE